MFGLKNATLWTFYTLDFFKKVYLGSITLLVTGGYILKKLADFLLLAFTFPGYWEGDTSKVQQLFQEISMDLTGFVAWVDFLPQVLPFNSFLFCDRYLLDRH